MKNTKKIVGKVGRPLEHRLSKKSKKQISESKMGHVHAAETKEKIRVSVTKWWAERKANKEEK